MKIKRHRQYVEDDILANKQIEDSKANELKRLQKLEKDLKALIKKRNELVLKQDIKNLLQG
jgi:hypothetical protein